MIIFLLTPVARIVKKAAPLGDTSSGDTSKWQGRVAQLVERGIENPCVGGSTPSLATTLDVFLFAALFVACKNPLWDRCERLCSDVASRVEACVGTELAWADVGAASRRDFAKQCRRGWVDETRALTSRELELGLTVCDDARDAVSDWTCAEVVERYGVHAADTASPSDSAVEASYSY